MRICFYSIAIGKTYARYVQGLVRSFNRLCRGMPIDLYVFSDFPVSGCINIHKRASDWTPDFLMKLRCMKELSKEKYDYYFHFDADCIFMKRFDIDKAISILEEYKMMIPFHEGWKGVYPQRRWWDRTLLEWKNLANEFGDDRDELFVPTNGGLFAVKHEYMDQMIGLAYRFNRFVLARDNRPTADEPLLYLASSIMNPGKSLDYQSWRNCGDLFMLFLSSRDIEQGPMRLNIRNDCKLKVDPSLEIDPCCIHVISKKYKHKILNYLGRDFNVKNHKYKIK